MRTTAFAAILVSSTMLSGCAGSLAGVSLGSLGSVAGLASTLFTGADLGEHAASLLTGKDCRFSEGIARADRNVCEERGSEATRGDFRGIFVERVDADGTVVYAAPRYMPASVGAGENENDADIIWAEIKAQKAREDEARMLLAQAAPGQQIDVAALASGSLSGESLGFLPVAGAAVAAGLDDEPASQMATRPRDLSNVPKAPARPVAPTPSPVDTTSDSEPPAIDERAFTTAIQVAQATGSGGPFISVDPPSQPMTSTLVNGEPVLVMRLTPEDTAVAFNASPAPARPIAAPAPVVAAPAVATPAPVAAKPVSPQAVVSSLPKTVRKAAEAPAVVASVTPEPVAAQPKARPTPVETTAAPVIKPAKPKPVPVSAPEDEAYEPPSSDMYSSAAPDLMPPPAFPAARADDSAGPATGGPAPLIPMPQP